MRFGGSLRPAPPWEHAVLRTSLVCGPRPAELFLLRDDDIEPHRIRIDQALKEAEKGTERIGEPGDTNRDRGEPNLLFPSESGTPFRIGNHLKWVLKPLATKAGIHDMTYQALRRICATYFQRHGTPRDVQAHLRHTSLVTTGMYMQQIPEQVQRAVEDLGAEFCGELGRVQ